jgi:hypothetical protein
LGSPLEESPQLLNSGPSTILHKIVANYKHHLWNNVAHFNFHGGPRDFLVSSDHANFNRFGFLNHSLSHTFTLETTKMKNVYQSLDHNSLFYYKFFLDQAAPIIAKIAWAKDSTP